MANGLISQIVTPAAGNRVHFSVRDWCADNAVFANKYPGDVAYLGWLAQRQWAQSRCRFAVAPDVVGDAPATFARSIPMFDRIRSTGFPVAFALQDGAEYMTIPWPRFDVAFIGGSTEWKIGPQAAMLAAEAKSHGKWVHMGRVNSLRRMLRAAEMGCDSVDGTYVSFGPDKNLPKVLNWLRIVNEGL